MKQTIILATVFLCGVACQNQSINESRAHESDGEVIVVNRRLFTEVPIHNGGFCNGNSGDNCAERLQLLQRQLMKLNPIMVPDQSETTTIPLMVATNQYKNFVADHQGEPVLPLFKQLYARVLLNQYGVLTSKNYALITYFTQQMVEANSLDFATIARSLTVLQNHIPAGQFGGMLTLAIKAAQEQKSWHEKTMADLSNDKEEASLKQSGTLSAEFMKEGRKRMLAEYKKSTILADLAQLYRLQEAID